MAATSRNRPQVRADHQSQSVPAVPVDEDSERQRREQERQELRHSQQPDSEALAERVISASNGSASSAISDRRTRRWTRATLDGTGGWSRQRSRYP
jgi:hypothetical protein